LCLLLVWSRFTRRLLIPGAILGVLALALAASGLLPATILDRLAQTIEYFGVFDVRTVEVTSDNWAVVERMAHWQAGWNMFVDHTWLGVGAGNYAQAYPDYFIGSWREPLGHAHNYYLNILAELGVMGGAVLLVFLGLAYRELGGALTRSEATVIPALATTRGLAPTGGREQPETLMNPSLAQTLAAPAIFWRYVLAGVLGGLIVFCVHNLFDSLFVHSVNVQVGILLGLGMLAAERVRNAVAVTG
jgi:O-antigen ligase